MKKKTIITVLLTIIALILVRKGVSFVYDKIEVMNAPTMQEIVEANPWTVPTDWFKTDTITIKGRIEDYTPMEVQLALADEETVCLTNRDFTRLQELFQFNGIPHYETITPDGRRVREDLSIHGYDDFDSELQRLLEKLK
jgi:hypothetical protein